MTGDDDYGYDGGYEPAQDNDEVLMLEYEPEGARASATLRPPLMHMGLLPFFSPAIYCWSGVR